MTEEDYGYVKALKAAGATVHVFEQFGSYQGDWWAKVTYEGKTGWIHDYYGSCSGCDAFESTFGWSTETPETLATFGREYLDRQFYTLDEAIAEARKNHEWDMSVDEMEKWLLEHADA